MNIQHFRSGICTEDTNHINEENYRGGETLYLNIIILQHHISISSLIKYLYT